VLHIYTTLGAQGLRKFKFYYNIIRISGKKVKVKVKQSHYRPGQALRVPGD